MLKNSLYEACFIPVKQNSPGPALHVRYRGSSLTLNRAYEKRVHLAEAACIALDEEDYELSAYYAQKGDDLEKLVKEEYGLEVLAMAALDFFNFMLSDMIDWGGRCWR